MRALIKEQSEPIAHLSERLKELEARVAKDSRNSSKPPSSDPPFKKPPPKSRRQRSGKNAGGQKDHPGATRALVENPEQTIVVPLAGVCRCGRDCGEIAAEVLPERRQVIGLLARRLLSSCQAELVTLLHAAVDGVDAPVVGVVSDGQRSIRNAVSKAFPGVPHQLCR